VELLGGEPLLHSDLLAVLGITGKYFYGLDLKLVTNGILLLKQTNEFWEICNKNNIKIVVTKYPINLQFSKIEQVAKKHNVILNYYGETELIPRMLHKVPLNISGNENQQKSFELCYKANSCISLDEGRIYTCPTVPYIKYFNKQFGTDLTISNEDYIDIYKIKTLDEIFEFLCKPIPFCRYCNTKGMVYRIDWSVSKKEISEWV
jgi:MoaA/NifB/PqqE/SkfB family radical SAM enzyme